MSSCQSQALLYTLHNSAYLKNILFPPTGGRSRWTVLPASPHWNIQRALRPLQEGETQLPGRNTVLKTEVRAWNKQLSDHSESGSRHAPGLAQQLVSKGAAFLLFLACGRICQLVRPQLGFQRVTLDFSTGRKNATPPYHFSIISIIVSQSSHLSNSCPFPSPPRYLTDTCPSLITVLRNWPQSTEPGEQHLLANAPSGLESFQSPRCFLTFSLKWNSEHWGVKMHVSEKQSPFLPWDFPGWAVVQIFST